MPLRLSPGPYAPGGARSAGQGDSSDNPLAKTVSGLYKAELKNQAGLWRTVEGVKFAPAGRVDLRNTKRLHSASGDIPPAEFEAA